MTKVEKMKYRSVTKNLRIIFLGVHHVVNVWESTFGLGVPKKKKTDRTWNMEPQTNLLHGL